MNSDNDEDFVVSAPVKKTKKNEGEEKTKKKKGSSAKEDRSSASPKRKTPKRKKGEDKDKDKDKEETKKAKGKTKAKKAEVEESEVAEIAEEEDAENLNPNEDENNESDAEEEAEEKSKKKKEKKLTKAKKEKGGAKDKDEEEILEYMKKQNRPYSVQNIFDNLHAKIKKAACQKILDSLVEDGHLQAKEYGKAKLYLLNQQNIPDVGAKELDKLKDSLNKTKQEHTKLADEVKEMAAYLKNLTNQLTNEQLNEEIEKYSKMVAEAQKKLELYESGNYPKISDEEMKVAEEKKKKYEAEFKKRKRMCMDMLNSIADSMEQKLANIIETVGIEID